jgi:Helix-turn-helix domain
MVSHLSVEQRQLALRLRARGLSLRQIGPRAGCSHELVRIIARGGPGRPQRRIDPWRPGPGRLKLADREEISLGLHAGEALCVIAARLGRATSAVSREVAGNGDRGGYRAWRAHQRARERARRPKVPKLACPRLAAQVTRWLQAWWSPQEISRAAQSGKGGFRAQPLGVVPGSDQELPGSVDADARQGDELRGDGSDQRCELSVEVVDLGLKCLPAAGQGPQGGFGCAGSDLGRDRDVGQRRRGPAGEDSGHAWNGAQVRARKGSQRRSALRLGCGLSWHCGGTLERSRGRWAGARTFTTMTPCQEMTGPSCGCARPTPTANA